MARQYHLSIVQFMKSLIMDIISILMEMMLEHLEQ